MTDIEEKILASKTRKVEELELSNQRTYDELREVAPNFGMDTSDLRRELLIDTLVELGIITQHQKLDFEITFHTKVEEALSGAWEQFRKAKAQAKKPKLVMPTKPNKLIGLDGKPLR